MQAMLIASESDERHMLQHVLQRAGLHVSIASGLEAALAAWPVRPAD